MPIRLEWADIAVRLLCTLAAGFAIGLNRSEHGRPAGLRTTMVVSLAASVAMILSNSMLGTAGRPGTSFIKLDLMRLPLGILAGLKRLELSLKQDRQGTLMAITGEDAPDEIAGKSREVTCAVQWRGLPFNTEAPRPVRALADCPGIVKVAWTPQSG